MKRRPIMELLITTLEAKQASGQPLENIGLDFPGRFFRPEAIGLRWIEVRLAEIEHLEDNDAQADAVFAFRCFVKSQPQGGQTHTLDDLADALMEVFDRSEGGGEISDDNRAIKPISITETRTEKTSAEAGGQTIEDVDLADIRITARVCKG